jgi:hypothetical protein
VQVLKSAAMRAFRFGKHQPKPPITSDRVEGNFRWEILMCGTIVIGIGAVVQILMPLAQRFGDTIGGTLYGAGLTLVATELVMIKERADSQRKHNELLRKSEAIGASAEGLGANFRGFALDMGMLFAQAVGGKKDERATCLSLARQLNVKDSVEKALSVKGGDLLYACAEVRTLLDERGGQLGAAFILGWLLSSVPMIY